MNVDAQEAAIGLLSMGHNYLSQPTPSTSSATLNSILTTTSSPVIPQKRKQSDIDLPESNSNNRVEFLQQQYIRLTHSPPSASASRSNGDESNRNDTSSEAVDCICGFSLDDGFSIACDECSRWCHSACFGIAPGSVPEKFACWTCKPRSAVEKEKAVRLQKGKLGMGDGDGKETKQRRRNSPGLERKQRRMQNAPATTPVDGGAPGKRKRHTSLTQQPPTPATALATPNGAPDEDLADTESEPWRDYYVHIVHDIVPNDDMRTKLRHQAAHWRGVTAFSSSPQNPTIVSSLSLETPPPVSVKPLSPQSSLNPFLSQNSNPLVLPPAFSLRTTQPIPSESFITPFRSCIIPSSTYLADPLNAYAHLGMPKPYVHLLGPPLDLALDARIVGNHGRFVRWGCKPNAVLRPILCERGSKETDQENSLGFGVFAAKDMKANEEIVLGWEWDDGNAVHLLPALLESPDTFPLISSLSTNRSHKLEHIKNQMSNILHALSSTFTTCACGALSKDCALNQMAAFVDGHDLGTLFQGKDQWNEFDSDDDITVIDIGPLIGRKRGFRTKERIPYSGGLGGMQMAADETVTGNNKGLIWDGRRPYKSPRSPPLTNFDHPHFSPPLSPTKKGKERAFNIDEDTEMLDSQSRIREIPESNQQSHTNHSPPPPSPFPESINTPPFKPRPPDPLDGGGDHDLVEEAEERMPPKMRKKWMHRELEARREPSTKRYQGGLGITVDLQDEHRLMPPPPIPAIPDSTTISSTSLSSSDNHSLSPLDYKSTCKPPAILHPPAMLSFSPTSGGSPLSSFAQLSLLSPALTSDFVRIPDSSVLAQLQQNSCAKAGSDSEVMKTNQVDDSAVVMSPPISDPSPTLVPSESEGEDHMIEDHESNKALPPFDSPLPGLSRNLLIYSRRHDEDDEVDYSPHSPAPSIQDFHVDGPSDKLRQSYEPSDVADVTSCEMLDEPHEGNVEPHTEQAVDPSAIPPIPLPSSDTDSVSPSIPETVPLQEPPSRNPPPKVKLTLKDFALRKKRQREEQELGRTTRASPVAPSPSLEGEEESTNILESHPGFSRRDDEFIANDRLSSLTSRSFGDSRLTVNGVGGMDPIGSKFDRASLEAVSTESPVPNENKIKTDPLLLYSPAISFFKSAAISASNGHSHPDRTSPQPSTPRLSSFATTKSNARDMKQETIEAAVPSLHRVADIERSVSPISPDPTPMVNRITQEEEGEIGEFPMLFSSRDSFGSKTDSLQRLPRNGPPTGPRGFYVNLPSTPSTRPSPTVPSNPPMAGNTTNGNRPNLLPTAPRALRQSMLHHRPGSGPPPATSITSPVSVPSTNNSSGTPFLPRGPSADREKDRVEWEQRHYRAPSRRGTGGGRGTAWGR